VSVFGLVPNSWLVSFGASRFGAENSSFPFSMSGLRHPLAESLGVAVSSGGQDPLDRGPKADPSSRRPPPPESRTGGEGGLCWWRRERDLTRRRIAPRAPYPPKFRASALGYRPTAGARRPRRARAASFRGGDVIGDFARWPPASQSLRAARGAGEVGRRNGFEGRREPVIGGRCSRGRYSTGGDSHVLRDCRSGSDRVRAEDVSERAFASVATWLSMVVLVFL
jgi:hypothetical protein